MLQLDVTLDPNFELTKQLNELAEKTASGELLREIEFDMASVAHPLIVANTPVITGSWRSAWAIYSEAEHTEIAIAPEAINPFSDTRPRKYGPIVHGMGGRSASGHERDVLNVVLRDHWEVIMAAGRGAAKKGMADLSLQVFA